MRDVVALSSWEVLVDISRRSTCASTDSTNAVSVRSSKASATPLAWLSISWSISSIVAHSDKVVKIVVHCGDASIDGLYLCKQRYRHGVELSASVATGSLSLCCSAMLFIWFQSTWYFWYGEFSSNYVRLFANELQLRWVLMVLL